MATVKYGDLSFWCETAIKGEDYVHLLDSEGNMIVAFDGVQYLSDFTITNGSWTEPTPEHECYVAVMKDDGTIGKGGHKCSDLATKLTDLKDVVVCDSMPEIFTDGRWYLVRAEV